MDATSATEPVVAPLVGLQQTIGNAAVTRLVQRKPRDRPASTDAPKKRKPAKPGAKAAKQRPKKDINARVIGVSIEKGMTKIAISAGPDKGVAVGMAGHLVRPDGKPYKNFEIVEIRGGASYAFVQATPDEVNANSKVVITPSSGGSPPVEQQHF